MTNSKYISRYFRTLDIIYSVGCKIATSKHVQSIACVLTLIVFDNAKQLIPKE